MSFVRQHRLLTIIFVVCIFLMLKNSSIPYLFVPPTFISFVFDKPQSDFLLGVAQLVDIFSSAYVTSLIFYFMVDYLPAIKQEKKAEEIVGPKLVSLYLYISELLAMIEYTAKQEKLWQTGNNDELDNLPIKDRTILCKRTTFKNGQNSGTGAHSYNILKDFDKYRELILNICNEITSVPSFSYCDPQLVHIISEIELSELLRMLPRSNDILTRLDLNVSYVGLGKGFQALLEVKNELTNFVETRLDYQMIDISQEEIQKWQQQNAEALEQHPEIAKIFIAQQLQEK